MLGSFPFPQRPSAWETNPDVVACVFLGLVLQRYLVSLWPHSGMGDAPQYGDYEAQRHWMEVTTKLPVGDWYRQTADNDLAYWGLDYPPLTAFASYAFGRLAELVGRGDLVALHASRGIETPASKVFMRFTVIIVDLLLYFPAIWCFFSAILTAAPRQDSEDGQGGSGGREAPRNPLACGLA